MMQEGKEGGGRGERGGEEEGVKEVRGRGRVQRNRAYV